MFTITPPPAPIARAAATERKNGARRFSANTSSHCAGVTVSSVWALIVAAAVFGVLNTMLKPLMRLVTLPLAILTLGIAWFFVSLLMLVLTNDIVDGFHIRGFWSFVEATFIVWLVNLVLDFTPGPWQVTGHRRRRSEIRRRGA